MAYFQLKKESGTIELKPWIEAWEPRTKLIAALLFLVGVVSLETVSLVVIASAVALLATLWMGLSYRYVLPKLAILLPFLIVMTIPLLFGAGWPVSADRLQLALLISFKACTSLFVMLIMLRTQSEEKLFTALAHLSIPSKLVTILFLSYRYLFLLLIELKQTLTAVRSRLFQERLSIKALQAYAHITAGLLIKAIDLAENVQKSLSSRCFAGKLSFGEAQRISLSDIVKAGMTIFFTLLLLIWERVYIL